MWTVWSTSSAWATWSLDEATKLKLMNHKNEWYLDLIQGMRKEDILPGAKELIES